MTADVITELVALVNAYHWRWIEFHGDHGADCALCAGLHERHQDALAMFVVELAWPDDEQVAA